MWGKRIGRGWVLAMLVAAHGCGDDEPADAPDAGDGDDACDRAVAAVTSSLERWQELSADEGATYWYDEEDCAPNKPTGTVTTVEVGPSGPRKVRSREIDPIECEVQVNRYETLGPSTFEQLYAMCKTLVMRECDTTFVTDDRGVVRSCTWDNDELCDDNCGHGFHLRRWGFGSAP